MVVLLVGLGIVVFGFNAWTMPSPTASSFTPSPSQLDALHNGTKFANAPGCSSNVDYSPTFEISPGKANQVVNVPVGDQFNVPAADSPLFLPDTPLCSVQSDSYDVTLYAARPGRTTIFVVPPGKLFVFEIRVVPSSASDGTPFILLGVFAIVVGAVLLYSSRKPRKDPPSPFVRADRQDSYDPTAGRRAAERVMNSVPPFMQ